MGARWGRCLLATAWILCATAPARAQVTAVLDKDAYREGEQMWLTVTTGKRRLSRPRVYAQARPGPVDLESPLREEFPPIIGTARLALRSPGFVTGTLDDGAPYVLGPGSWSLYLYDGSRLLARVPFTMLARPGQPGPVATSGNATEGPRVLERVDREPLSQGRAFTVAVSPPRDAAGGDLELRWAMAMPGGGGPRPPEPPGAFSTATPVPSGAARRTVEVFAPYASGRFELQLVGGGATLATLVVEVK